MKIISNLRLYHYPLCPASRKVRLFLHENQINFTQVIEETWRERENFYKLNPFGEVPFLVVKLEDSENKNNFLSIQGSECILRYLCKKLNKDYYCIREKILDEDTLLELRVEIDKIINWFDNKFYKEVVEIILEEKLYTVIQKKSTNENFLKIARNNLIVHFDYFTKIISERNFFATEHSTFADITAMSYISTLDYLNEINWDDYSVLKDWYSVMKSKPISKNILNDNITEVHPSVNYRNLDF